MLDDVDLDRIDHIVQQAFNNLPLNLLTKFRDGAVAQYQLYNIDGPSYLMLRIQRIGSSLQLEFLDTDNDRIHVTRLVGI